MLRRSVVSGLAGASGWEDGGEAEVPVVVAGEAGLVDDGAGVVLQDLAEKPGEVGHRDADAGDVLRGSVDGDV